MTAVGDQTSLADRKRRAGNRLVLGFAGTDVDPALRELSREIQPAGFILFQRNVESPFQVAELNASLAGLVPRAEPTLISVDQEGGRVQRVREPATVWPPMRHVAQRGGITADVATALAHELRAMGFNLNYAPDADVDSNPENPVIGDRSFGDSSTAVGDHVAAWVRAQQGAGVLACAKHFPGHGDTAVDSHHDLPYVETDESVLWAREIPPFAAAIEADVAAVMASHVVYRTWDAELPATLSSVVVPQQLRRRLGYDGLVVSDDMEMGAIAGRYDVEEQVRRTTEATIDLLLVCHTPDLQLAMFEAMVRAQEQSPTFERACRDAERRLRSVQQRLAQRDGPAPGADCIGCHDHRILAANARLGAS